MKTLLLLSLCVFMSGCADRDKPIRELIEYLVPGQSIKFIMNHGSLVKNQRYFKVTRISQEEYAQ